MAHVWHFDSALDACIVNVVSGRPIFPQPVSHVRQIDADNGKRVTESIDEIIND